MPVSAQYLLVVLIVAAATLLRLVLGWTLGIRAPFGTFYPAVILAAFIGGLGPALLAVGLSVVLAVLLFLDPESMGGMKSPGEVITLGMFIGSGVLLAVMAQHTARIRVARARRESEKRFSTFMDNTPAIAWMKNEQGQYVYVSKAYENAFNISRNGWIGKSDMDLWPAEVAEQWRKTDEKVLTSGNPVEAVETTITGGEKRYWLYNKFPFTDESGNRYVAGIGVEITRRRQAEEALRAERARLRAILDSIPLGVWIADISGRIIENNKQAKIIWGESMPNPKMTSEYGLFKGWWPGTGVELRAEDWALYRALRNGETIIGEEVDIRRFDGTSGTVLNNAAPVRDTEGQIIGGVVIQQEITERKRAEEALRKSEERLSALITATSEVLFRTSLDWSEIQRLDAGFLSDEPSPYREWAQKYIHPDEQARVIAAIQEAVTKKASFELEHRFRRRDGTWGWTFSRAIPIIGTKGEIVEWFGATTDITARKQYEEELARSRDVLERLVRERTDELRSAYDRLVAESKQRQQVEEQLVQSRKMEAVGTLAGGIAHDFNNMLAVIIGNAELAQDEPDERHEHEIEQILKASYRARDLVKQILTFSRRSDRTAKPLALSPIVKETVKLLRGSLPSTIRIDAEIASKADTVLGDPTQVQQVLVNLASNSAFAMRDEGGTLSIRLSDILLRENDVKPDPKMEPGRYLKLEVEDTGSGMTEEVRNRIFDPFFTTKEQGEGTGMGLAMVFGIVRDMQGVIIVESSPGEGSRFTVFLPALEELASEEEHEPGLLPKGNGRILLVDDEPLVLEVVSTTLERLGYRVTCAGSGRKALEIFQAAPHEFDLLITDHVMPEMTGLRLAETVLGIRKQMPVILFTGYSETVSAEKAKASGVKEFIMKPVVKKDLAEAVRRVLDE